MNYITAFFENLFNNMLGGTASIVPSATETTVSVLPTVTYSAASETIARGFEHEDSLVGTSLVGTGSSVSSAAMDANAASNYDYDIKAAQAYVESMDEIELNEFIEKLEGVQIVEQPKVLQKTLNNNNFPRV